MIYANHEVFPTVNDSDKNSSIINVDVFPSIYDSNSDPSVDNEDASKYIDTSPLNILELKVQSEISVDSTFHLSNNGLEETISPDDKRTTIPLNITSEVTHPVVIRKIYNTLTYIPSPSIPPSVPSIKKIIIIV